MQLSTHFSFEEMTFSETAARKDISNEPDADQLENLHFTASRMEEVRTLLGVPIRVTSGFRSARVNALVGGSKKSDHMEGLACDFLAMGVDNYDAAKRIEASDIQYSQMILEYGWLHLGFGNAMQRVSLTKKSASAPYLKGLVA